MGKALQDLDRVHLGHLGIYDARFHNRSHPIDFPYSN